MNWQRHLTCYDGDARGDGMHCTVEWRVARAATRKLKDASSSQVRTKLESPYTTSRGRPRAGHGTPNPRARTCVREWPAVCEERGRAMKTSFSASVSFKPTRRRVCGENTPQTRELQGHLETSIIMRLPRLERMCPQRRSLRREHERWRGGRMMAAL